jgi:prolyl-tRNA editing enzyme YbaK/EbsC (Cys-tRNA(Pro) deacylase)
MERETSPENISSEEIERQVRSTLDDAGVEYEWIKVDPDFADTAAFCEKYGFQMTQCGNMIIVASKRGEKKYSGCIVRGTDRIDVNKKVRSLMEVSRLSFATAEETIDLTGMMIGGVTPFALPESLPIYVDAMIMDLDYVILGGGSRSGKLKVDPSSLLNIPTVVVIEDLSIKSDG